MKQKINLMLIAISVMAVLSTVVCLTLIFYELFQEQVKKDLRTQAQILSAAGVTGITENAEVTSDIAIGGQLRLTWISKSGDVIFDNDAGNLTNHLDRPEVKAAFTSGTGEAVRKSDTLNMKTFYYAMLLADGTVLRLATEARSLASIFLSAFRVIFFLIASIIIICIVISHLWTNHFLEPIRNMADDIDNQAVTTPYKELEPFVKRIREQHNDILLAAKSRQDFTANVSHELKTPITAISGYAELIENKMADENQQIKFAGEIRKQADRLVSLVNDIIRLSELDHRESIPQFTKVDIYDISAERVEFLQNNARKKNVQLQLSGEHCLVTSNKDLLTELLDNLIQNAIRYNVPNGRVNVCVKPSGQQTELTVSDTGIGIPAQDIDRVFERFYRVDKSRSRETGGTGLGLAIVKHIVELHDGEISISSTVGKGTIICVKL